MMGEMKEMHEECEKMMGGNGGMMKGGMGNMMNGMMGSSNGEGMSQEEHESHHR